MKFFGMLLISTSMFASFLNPIPAKLSIINSSKNPIRAFSIIDKEILTEERFFEEEGGFSYVPPEGWVIREIPGYKYKAVFGPLTDSFAPNINFADEQYDGSIGDYVTYNIEAIKEIFKDAKVLKTEAFITDSGIIGAKVIISNTLIDNKLLQTFYLLDGGQRKICMTYSRLYSKGAELDQLADATARSLALSSGCATPLPANEFEEEFSRVSFSLPTGWAPVTGTPGNNYRTYANNSDDAGIFLMIFAFRSNGEPYDCLVERANFLQNQFSQNGMSLEKINVDTEEYVIDGNPSSVAIAEGYSNTEMKIPIRLVVLGIKNNDTIFVFNFTASGETIQQAKTAIEELDENFDLIVRSISID